MLFPDTGLSTRKQNTGEVILQILSSLGELIFIYKLTIRMVIGRTDHDTKGCSRFVHTLVTCYIYIPVVTICKRVMLIFPDFILSLNSQNKLQTCMSEVTMKKLIYGFYRVTSQYSICITVLRVKTNLNKRIRRMSFLK